MFEHEDKIEKIINGIDNSELLQLCNEIYDYQNGNGDLDKNSKFYKLFKDVQEKYQIDIRYFETILIDLSISRFENVVKLLILNRPYCFITK